MDRKPYTTDDLTSMTKEHNHFVGIDSDGCVFDTMEIKQKKCFHTRIISHWHLEPIEKELRESAEFVNLYSQWRGKNRFLSLLMSFDQIRKHPRVIQTGVKLPALPSLRNWVNSGVPLGNPTLKQAVTDTGDEELESVLQWSLDVNADIALVVKDLPPFKWVKESLARIASSADAIVVSQTPCEALLREWEENDIDGYVKLIAGQELGKKSEHIALATGGRYGPSTMLMIGDALGDLNAAKANHALFFPTNPGNEEGSWEHFYSEAFDRFLAGEYAGEYEQRLVDEFLALLPDAPQWEGGFTLPA